MRFGVRRGFCSASDVPCTIKLNRGVAILSKYNFLIEYEVESLCSVCVSYFSVIAFSESHALDIIIELFGDSDIFVGATLSSIDKI